MKKIVTYILFCFLVIIYYNLMYLKSNQQMFSFSQIIKVSSIIHDMKTVYVETKPFKAAGSVKRVTRLCVDESVKYLRLVKVIRKKVFPTDKQ